MENKKKIYEYSVMFYGNTASVASTIKKYLPLLSTIILKPIEITPTISNLNNELLPRTNIDFLLTCLKKGALANHNVIHHFNYLIGTQAIIAPILKLKHAPIVAHFHGDDAYVKKSIYSLARDLIATNALVWLYSTPDLYIPLSRYHTEKPRIWLPNPIDIELAKSYLKNKDRVDDVLVWTAIDESKGIFQIYEKIKNDGNTYILLDNNSITAKKLKNKIRRERVTNIKWHQPIPHKDIFEFLSRFKRVIPQHSYVTLALGSYGMCELEAAAVGCKIIGMPWLNYKFIKKNHNVKKVVDSLLKIYEYVISKDIVALHEIEKRPMFNGMRSPPKFVK